MLIDFRENGREEEREGEKRRCKREIDQLVAFYMFPERGLNPHPRHEP